MARNGIRTGHRLEDLTEDQIRAYILADNKLAENAGGTRKYWLLNSST